MRSRRAVIDTNVLISAVLSPEGTASNATRYFIRQGRIIFSPETFTEFETRLWRPKFDAYITMEARKEIIHDLGAIAEWVEIGGKAQYSRDSDDDKFVETALVGRAEYLVTGDKDLLVLKSVDRVLIVSPAQCLKLL